MYVKSYTYFVVLCTTHSIFNFHLAVLKSIYHILYCYIFVIFIIIIAFDLLFYLSHILWHHTYLCMISFFLNLSWRHICHICHDVILVNHSMMSYLSLISWRHTCHIYHVKFWHIMTSNLSHRSWRDTCHIYHDVTFVTYHDVILVTYKVTSVVGKYPMVKLLISLLIVAPATMELELVQTPMVPNHWRRKYSDCIVK